MTDQDSSLPVPAEQLPAAPSEWENEGEASRQTGPEHPASDEDPPLANADLVQLRIRVVALENLMLAVLAEGTEAQAALAKKMASYILPREGHTAHPVTIHAAQQMLHLVERASRLKRSE